jgi:hypothetical protein
MQLFASIRVLFASMRCGLLSGLPIKQLKRPQPLPRWLGLPSGKLSHSQDRTRSETRTCTCKIANGESDLTNVRFWCTLRTQVRHLPRSAKCPYWKSGRRSTQPYDASSPSSAFASVRSRVSKPSVNQPRRIRLPGHQSDIASNSMNIGRPLNPQERTNAGHCGTVPRAASARTVGSSHLALVAPKARP